MNINRYAVAETQKHLRSDPTVYRDIALKIGGRLVADAVWHQNRCTWTGDSLRLIENDWKVVHGSVDDSLYSGTSGIAVYLALLWRVTGDKNLRHVAEGAVRQTLRLVDSRDSPRSYGLYGGLMGVSWALITVGDILRKKSFSNKGQQLARRISKELKKQSTVVGVDLVDGLSGVLIGLLHIAKTANDQTLLQDCDEIANRILSVATKTTAGFSWRTTELNSEGPHLCGMAHGASGIAYALMEYFKLVGRKELREAAMEAVRYERGWFNRAYSNWPDIRDPNNEAPTGAESFSYPVYWCHGAAGIGLVRLRMYQLTNDPSLLAEAGAAIQAAIAFDRNLRRRQIASSNEGYESNFSVCHGLGSIIELFTYAYQVLGLEEYLNRARRIGDLGIENELTSGGRWRCGIPEGGENPGLMLGLAGIGICYLRLFNTEVAAPVGIF